MNNAIIYILQSQYIGMYDSDTIHTCGWVSSEEEAQEWMSSAYKNEYRTYEEVYKYE